jgi:transposase
VPAIQPYIIEPIWEQFSALLPERKSNHPLGCHRRRIPDRVVFEKLVQVLVFGSAPTGGSPTRDARLPRSGADATSG